MGQEIQTVQTIQAIVSTAAQWTADEQKALLARAYRGDKTVLPELRAMLDAHPEVVQREGDLPREAQLAMTRAVAGDDIALPEVMVRRVAQLRAELEGTYPTPLERLLSERVVTCWLAVYLLDTATVETPDGQRPPTRIIVQHERARESAHRRYLDACLALAKVRRLMRPPLQVNIAQAGAQQLNVSPDPRPDPPQLPDSTG